MKTVLALLIVVLTIPFEFVIAAANTHSNDLELSSSQYWSDTTTSGIQGTGDFTIDALFKLEQLPSAAGNHFGLFTNGTSAGTSNSIALRLLTTNQFYCTYENGSGLSQFRTNAFSAADVGVWHQITCAVDVSAGTAQFYLDGVATTTVIVEALANSRASVDDIYIGWDTYGAGRYWDGRLDEVAFYTTQLGAAPDPCARTASDSGIASWWKFDNDSTDETASANELSFNGGSPSYSTDVDDACAAAAAFIHADLIWIE